MTENVKKTQLTAIAAIRECLESGRKSDIVCLLIPSATRHNKPIGAQKQAIWAGQALDLFGEIFTGATAFQHLKGIFCLRDGSAPMYDDPIMVQPLAYRADVENEKYLLKLAQFVQNMGSETDQHSVGVILNNWFINIEIGA